MGIPITKVFEVWMVRKRWRKRAVSPITKVGVAHKIRAQEYSRLGAMVRHNPREPIAKGFGA